MSRGTTHRTIRIVDEIWKPALQIAEKRGETLTDVVRDALIGYVAMHEARPEPRNDDKQPDPTP